MLKWANNTWTLCVKTSYLLLLMFLIFSSVRFWWTVCMTWKNEKHCAYASAWLQSLCQITDSIFSFSLAGSVFLSWWHERLFSIPVQLAASSFKIILSSPIKRKRWGGFLQLVLMKSPSLPPSPSLLCDPPTGGQKNLLWAFFQVSSIWHFSTLKKNVRNCLIIFKIFSEVYNVSILF